MTKNLLYACMNIKERVKKFTKTQSVVDFLSILVCIYHIAGLY